MHGRWNDVPGLPRELDLQGYLRLGMARLCSYIGDYGGFALDAYPGLRLCITGGQGLLDSAALLRTAKCWFYAYRLSYLIYARDLVERESGKLRFGPYAVWLIVANWHIDVGRGAAGTCAVVAFHNRVPAMVLPSFPCDTQELELIVHPAVRSRWPRSWHRWLRSRRQGDPDAASEHWTFSIADLR